VVVRVERRFTHSLVQEDGAPDQEILRARREQRVQGRDLVWIEEHAPISKLKRWAVVRGEKKKASVSLKKSSEWGSHDPDAIPISTWRTIAGARRVMCIKVLGGLEAQIRHHRRRHRPSL